MMLLQRTFRRLGLPLTVILAFVLGAIGCKEDLSPDQRWLVTVTEQIVRNHQKLAQRTSKQHEQSVSFCRSPSQQGLEKLQQGWRDSMALWQRLQWVRFGPITQHNDDWKLQFWPDKKNILQRKVQDLLNAQEPINSESLAKASVVVQGLSAQELLLFDAQFATVDRFQTRQCELLVANTALTAQVTDRLAQQWRDKEWLEGWFKPTAQREGQTAAQKRDGELLDAFLTQVEKLKGDKLGEPMGLKTRDKKANGYFAESWRSQSSLNNIRQNLSALQQMAAPKKGYGLFQYLKDKNHPDVADALIIKLDNVALALQQIHGSLQSAVIDPQQQDALQASYRALGELASFSKTQLAPALELTLGFNSNDGD